jgi:hypothetical protein
MIMVLLYLLIPDDILIALGYSNPYIRSTSIIGLDQLFGTVLILAKSK